MSGIDIRSVSKHFGTKRVLDTIDLSVADGEFVALLGPSGCGKTTLLRIVAGLENPDTGSVSVGGSVADDPARRIHVAAHRRNIGMVFQSYALWPHMSVGGNVGYPLRSRRHRGRSVAVEVERVLGLVGLTGFADRAVSSLSGGQQQRVAVARALVADPTALLLDEPLSNLDAQLRATLRSELRRIQREAPRTTVYVTHDQTEALTLADRVVVMLDGTITQTGSPAEVFASPADRRVAGFVGYDNVLDATVTRIHDSQATVRIGTDGPDPIEIHARTGRTDLAAGENTVLAFRSNGIALHRNPAPAQGARIPGTVIDAVRLGDQLECLISWNNTTIRAEVPTRTVATMPSVGEQIWLDISSDTAVLVASANR